MVTRSIDNWQKHKEDVKRKVSELYGSGVADAFLRFYASRFDRFGRTFLSWKGAFWLMDDYHAINKIGTKWYACVGDGGTGKTTLMKNVLYFLDDSFNTERVQLDNQAFIKELKKLLPDSVEVMERGTPKGLLMDEPDDEGSHAQSFKGKQLRDILGKARQQKLALAICATDLTDIPPYIFRKVSGIFFCPVLGKAMFFKNRPRKRSYPLQQIRREYAKKGYKIFFELQKEAGCVLLDTTPRTPFTEEQESLYKKDKLADYRKSVDNFLEPKLSRYGSKAELVAKLRAKGLTEKQIGEKVGLTQQRVNQLINVAKNKGILSGI